MRNAVRRERVHAARATFFAKIPGVIIGETQDIEACVLIMLRVSRWRSKQITGLWVAAGFARLAAIHEYSLKIAKRDVGGGEDRRNVSEKADAIIIRQVVLRIVSTNHHVADGGDADAQRRFVEQRR